MKIGFIGTGNMSTAIIAGLLKKKVVSPSDIIASRRTESALIALHEEYGILTTTDNCKVAKEADIVFLAVKPVFMQQVIEEIRDSIHEDKIIITIAAGKKMEFYETLFGKKIKLVRCMPNTPAFVLEGCTGMCHNGNLSKEELDTVLSILNSFGKAGMVAENLMDAVVAVSGSSPAYVFMMIEAMADAAVNAGMMRKQAYEFAAQAVLGSAKMVLEMEKHPGELKDMVCSPGGTTIEAVKVLEECGFRAAIMEAMEACVNKSKNL